MGAVTVGVDIGQRRDPTAIAVVEQEERRSSETHHIARHLERLPLGSPYPAVAERVAAVVRGVLAATSGEAPTLYVDATGVGTPIVDVLRAASVGDLAQLVAVYFTMATGVKWSEARSNWAKRGSSLGCRRSSNLDCYICPEPPRLKSWAKSSLITRSGSQKT